MNRKPVARPKMRKYEQIHRMLETFERKVDQADSIPADIAIENTLRWVLGMEETIKIA